ncbi:carbohydrate ABC transporter substrate-binding protein [Shewanella canadensis]|uniref:Carbohydrate ABC transporter substrate-binding protein n=1 Tax=Shewanella canadensis TaxID=271096 RepID=A0A431WRE5_9GAMM|nr:ABC transporter substrate-binding protein [Shewanella canadensis]RTR38021.1 carbohydrate ABC transporter substrate-binding protein [Shewanella canadensis]
MSDIRQNKLFTLLLLSIAWLSLDVHALFDPQLKSAEYWVTNEFQPSTLTQAEQMQEMNWFVEASKPYFGLQIRVVSERIATHGYEASVLAKAFFEITGIHVVHELTGEDDVINKLSAQIFTQQNLYDAYINDSDLIGTHFRSNAVLPLSDFMKNEGAVVTLPTLDLNDFIGLKFTTGPDGKLYQLPDQQFANLYWYRHDWFNREDFKQRFKLRYGYELGVPQNWQAYEDIAEFFSDDVKEIDGKRIYGHMDYAKTDPSLGWRMSDAWLSMAGVGDKGLPNGLPVDEWGIRVEHCRPVGASVERGGALNGPASVYAVDKFIYWLHRFAPEESIELNFTQAGEWPGKGLIAQQIFWYTAFVADLTKPGLPVMNPDGTPKWRVAPSPVGKYWQDGMKSGYQDTGAWTLLKNTPLERQQAAWLYAQFVVSKTVSLKKTLVGLTPIRLSDIESDVMTQRAPYLGGLVEFYRSRGRDVWTPTGTNVPDYPGLANFWWHYISQIIEGKVTVQKGMDNFAAAVDKKLKQIGERADMKCAPKLNPISKREFWLKAPGAPKREISATQVGKTLSYEEAINVWK